MLENLLYGWLVVRLLLSVALGVRAANRLRHDAATRAELHRMVGLHVVAAGVTWLLEALIREQNLPANAAPVVRAFVLPIMLVWTMWVPAVDAAGFALVSVSVSALLARGRLARYQRDLLLGEPGQRVRAARACEFLGTLARPAVPELVDVMTDPDPELRFRAARALGRVNARDPAATDVLRRALTDRDERVVLAAACALALLKESDPPVVAGAVAALAVEDDEMRGEGLRAVLALGPAAGAAAAERVLALVDHWKFGARVPPVLGKIGPEAVPALVVLLAHPSPRIRSAAVTELGKLGPRAAVAVAELEARRRDRDPIVRSAVAQALRAVRV